MDMRKLGRSGLKVSRLCLGTMMFGGPTDETTSAAIVSDARDAGVNFIDTADAYNGGASEGVVGSAIKEDRDRWVLATKCANPMGGDPNRVGLARKWVIKACEGSLKRLGTDYVDILYLHKEDHGTALEETVGALADLMRNGKILYYGLSNYRSWRVAEICRIADQMGIDRPIVSQPYYNAMNRMPETEHLPACRHFGLGVVPYSPLARGILTGKYAPNVAPDEGSRAGRQDKRMMQTEWRHESLEIAQEIKSHAEAKGGTPIGFAVNWVLANPIITATIAGPRTMEQWKAYKEALDYPWSDDDEALIDRLVASGHPSTPGYNDPQYPIEGRPF